MSEDFEPQHAKRIILHWSSCSSALIRHTIDAFRSQCPFAGTGTPGVLAQRTLESCIHAATLQSVKPVQNVERGAFNRAFLTIHYTLHTLLRKFCLGHILCGRRDFSTTADHVLRISIRRIHVLGSDAKEMGFLSAPRLQKLTLDRRKSTRSNKSYESTLSSNSPFLNLSYQNQCQRRKRARRDNSPSALLNPPICDH